MSLLFADALLTAYSLNYFCSPSCLDQVISPFSHFRSYDVWNETDWFHSYLIRPRCDVSRATFEWRSHRFFIWTRESIDMIAAQNSCHYFQPLKKLQCECFNGSIRKCIINSVVYYLVSSSDGVDLVICCECSVVASRRQIVNVTHYQGPFTETFISRNCWITALHCLLKFPWVKFRKSCPLPELLLD